MKAKRQIQIASFSSFCSTLISCYEAYCNIASRFKQGRAGRRVKVGVAPTKKSAKEKESVHGDAGIRLQCFTKETFPPGKQTGLDKGTFASAKGKERDGRSSRVFVCNLPFETSETWVRNTFGVFGSIVSVQVLKGPNRRGRYFGFVEFSSPEAALEAVECLHGFRVKGYDLLVAIARPGQRKKSPGDTKKQSIHFVSPEIQSSRSPPVIRPPMTSQKPSESPLEPVINNTPILAGGDTVDQVPAGKSRQVLETDPLNRGAVSRPIPSDLMRDLRPVTDLPGHDLRLDLLRDREEDEFTLSLNACAADSNARGKNRDIGPVVFGPATGPASRSQVLTFIPPNFTSAQQATDDSTKVVSELACAQEDNAHRPDQFPQQVATCDTAGNQGSPWKEALLTPPVSNVTDHPKRRGRPKKVQSKGIVSPTVVYQTRAKTSADKGNNSDSFVVNIAKKDSSGNWSFCTKVGKKVVNRCPLAIVPLNSVDAPRRLEEAVKDCEDEYPDPNTGKALIPITIANRFKCLISGRAQASRPV